MTGESPAGEGASAPMRPARAPGADGSEPRRLRLLADDLAWLVLALRAGDRPEDVGVLRRRIRGALAEFGARALALGHAPASVADARFALGALLDETLAALDERAGAAGAADVASASDGADVTDDFFDRLERLRDMPERDAEVLEVFQLCLTLGYRGRYRFEGDEKLRYLANSVGQDLVRMRGERAVFVQGAQPPGTPRPRRPAPFPMARLLIGACVVTVFAWIVYRLILDRRAATVLDAARSVLEP